MFKCLYDYQNIYFFERYKKVVGESIKLILFLFEGSVILTEHGLALHW